MKIAIIGAGTMGSGIAEVFARLGHTVALYSRSRSTLDAARQSLGAEAGQVRFTTDLAACLEGAQVVSENVAEDPALKCDLFAAIETHVDGDCLLTSNTSSVPIGSIAARLRQPERLVGLHWFNPPAVMPLRGPATADSVVDRVAALSRAIGKESIEVRTDVPGFVINRLQYAILREALHLVESGVASIRDVDRAVETTLAPRWASAGPLRLMDLAGLDTVAKVSAILMPALDRGVDVPALVSRLAAERHLGSKTGRGFYTWTSEEITAAKADRDDVVRLLTERRGA